MAQRIGGETRMTIAKRVLHDVIAAIPEREGVNVGFRLYGHRGDDVLHLSDESVAAPKPSATASPLWSWPIKPSLAHDR
jgi:hypothetical protein